MEEGEEEILEIFGDVKVGDLMGAQMSGNWGFLDQLQPSIRNHMTTQCEKTGGKEALAKKLGASMVSFFVPDEQNKGRVIEGFEPETIVQEVVLKNILRIMDIIVKGKFL